MLAARVDERELLSRIDALEKRGGNLSPVMAVISEIMLGGVEDEFETEGRGQWPPLAPSTLRRRRGGSAKILQDTGVLAGSAYARHGADFAEVGLGARYAIYHVTGTSRMPARNPFDVADRVWDEAVNALFDYLAEAGA